MIGTLSGAFGRNAWGAYLALGLVAGWWLSGRSGSRIEAQAPANGLRTVPSIQLQITGNPGETQWLTLVNSDTQSLVVYRFEPNNPRGALKLEAARHFRWDLMLSEYQNQPPEVSAVESMTRNRPKP